MGSSWHAAGPMASLCGASPPLSGGMNGAAERVSRSIHLVVMHAFIVKRNYEASLMSPHHCGPDMVGLVGDGQSPPYRMVIENRMVYTRPERVPMPNVDPEKTELEGR